jgi:hypothetical protein
MGEISRLLGKPAQKMPEDLKQVIREAQQLMASHKGL